MISFQTQSKRVGKWRILVNKYLIVISERINYLIGWKVYLCVTKYKDFRATLIPTFDMLSIHHDFWSKATGIRKWITWNRKFTNSVIAFIFKFLYLLYILHSFCKWNFFLLQFLCHYKFFSRKPSVLIYILRTG